MLKSRFVVDKWLLFSVNYTSVHFRPSAEFSVCVLNLCYTFIHNDIYAIIQLPLGSVQSVCHMFSALKLLSRLCPNFLRLYQLQEHLRTVSLEELEVHGFMYDRLLIHGISSCVRTSWLVLQASPVNSWSVKPLWAVTPCFCSFLHCSFSRLSISS